MLSDMKEENWIAINKTLPAENCEVLGYSPKWIDEDFNPEGIRICVYFGGVWTSSVWNDEYETYESDDTEPTFWRSIPQPPKERDGKYDYIARMVKEKNELAKKLISALDYYHSQEPETYENELLYEQIRYMQNYVDVLQKRINYAYRKKHGEEMLKGITTQTISPDIGPIDSKGFPVDGVWKVYAERKEEDNATKAVGRNPPRIEI